MNKSVQLKLNNLHFAIVSHIFASGPALELEEYLKNKAKTKFEEGLKKTIRWYLEHGRKLHGAK